MEMTEKYLENMTLIADFWVSDENNNIKSVENEGIAIRKSKTYLNKYHVNVILKSKEYDHLDLFAKGWDKRYPKAVMTKGNEKVEALDLRYLGTDNKGDFSVLNFIGAPIK